MMKPLKSNAEKNAVKDFGNGGEKMSISENQQTDISTVESDSMNELETLPPQRVSEKADENTTMRMERALSLVKLDFNLEGRDFVLIAFDDKGEGKKCKITLANDTYTVSVTINEF